MKSIYLFNGNRIPKEYYEEIINIYPIAIPPHLLENNKISNKWAYKLINELSKIGETRMYINNTEYLLKNLEPIDQLEIVNKAASYLGLRREEIVLYYEKIIEEACDIIRYNKKITNKRIAPLELTIEPLIIINRVIEELSKTITYNDENMISIMVPNMIMKTELLENKLLIEARPIKIETILNNKADITNYLNNVITIRLMP